MSEPPLVYRDAAPCAAEWTHEVHRPLQFPLPTVELVGVRRRAELPLERGTRGELRNWKPRRMTEVSKVATIATVVIARRGRIVVGPLLHVSEQDRGLPLDGHVSAMASVVSVASDDRPRRSEARHGEIAR